MDLPEPITELAVNVKFKGTDAYFIAEIAEHMAMKPGELVRDIVKQWLKAHDRG